ALRKGGPVSSSRTDVLDPPAAEEFPRWLTLREASFLTGLDEASLRVLVASGRVGCDRSLSRKLGDGYLLLPSKDLREAGLLPASRAGDLVLDRAIPAADVRVGDAVTLLDHATGTARTTRVRTIERVGTYLRLEVRADREANVQSVAVPFASSIDQVDGRIM